MVHSTPLIPWMTALLALTFGVARADRPTSNHLDSSSRPPASESARGPSLAGPAPDDREGGEDIPTAFVIPGDVTLLPFHDTGSTCDQVNDYDEVCPFAGSTAPDVVYSFTPSADIRVTVDLCASAYDTKVYIYEGDPGSLIACNEYGACGYSQWQSYLYSVPLTGGSTYYIVIDGYGTSCGEYDLTLFRPDCVVECPAGGQPEGEPPCADGYHDQFNSGCYNNEPVFFSPIVAGADGCATICGRSCTFDFEGLSYRDTDWYRATAAGGPVSITCEAEFPLLMYLVRWTNCSIFLEDGVEALPCRLAERSYNYSPGQELWVYVAPIVFEGVPESDYVFTICGLAPAATPVKAMTWGRIKSTYR